MPITLNGTTGITTPGLINTGSTTFVDLTTTGNTILGDASTDTLNVANGNLVLNSSGNLGVGTASPAAKLDVRGNSASTTVMVGAYVYNENITTNSQAGLGFFNYDNFGAKIYALRSGSSAGNLVFATNGGGGIGESNVAERARIDSSGNLGIGTSSPSQKLEVAGNMYINTSGNPYLQIKTSGAGNNPYIRMQADTNYWDIQSTFSNTNDDLLFQYNGTALLDLDKNGNLGLGVTPSAWTTYKAIQINNNGAGFWGGSGLATMSLNTYYDGSYRYQASSFASDYYQYAGTHVWRTAASGTAGNAITFTQAMTLDASGNLGVGTTSPQAKVHATGTIKVATGNAQGILALGDGAGTTVNCGVWRGAANAPTSDGNFLNFGGYDGLVFATGNAAIGSQTERARITSGGNLLVGGTTDLASGKLVVGDNTTNTPLVVRGAGGVDGAFVNCFLSYPWNTTEVNAIQSSISSSGTGSGWRFQASIGGGSATTYKTLDSLRDLTVFYTQNTERARINSSGNFGVANTGPEYLVDVGSNSGGAFLRAQGAYLSRKYTFGENLSASRVMRLTISLNGLQFTNIFMDASAHYYNNGGLWQAQRYAFQVMAEGGTLRHNIRMPNYEYGGATAGVFTVGNPPSWTYVSGTTYYFDFTAVAGYVSYIAISAEGPGIVDLTLTVIS